MTNELGPLPTPAPPNGSGIDQNWRPTLTEVLEPGDVFSIDAERSIGDLSSIGIDKAGYPEGASVVAKISDPMDRSKYPGENGINIAIVRSPNTSGSVSLFLVSEKVDEDGTATSEWTQLSQGIELTVGREKDKEADDPAVLDGEMLTGKDFSGGISRKHLTIRNFQGKRIDIKGLGMNGTKVEAIKAQPDRSVAASGVLHSSSVGIDPVSDDNERAPGFIDSVPKTPEEARQKNEQREQAKRDAANAPIQEAIDGSRLAMDKIMKDLDLSGRDVAELHAYVQAKNMKAMWQDSGRGDLSMASGENISTAMNNMSPAARSVTDRWFSLQGHIDSLQDRLK